MHLAGLETPVEEQSCSISSLFPSLNGSIRKSLDPPGHKTPTPQTCGTSHRQQIKCGAPPGCSKAHPELRNHQESSAGAGQTRRAAQAEGVKATQIQTLPFFEMKSTQICIHSHSRSLFAALWQLVGNFFFGFTAGKSRDSAPDPSLSPSLELPAGKPE